MMDTTSIQPIDDIVTNSLINNTLVNDTDVCRVPDRIKGTDLVLLTVFGAIVGAISLTGNLIIIIVFAKYKELQKPGNVFLTNLALGDLLYGSIAFPMYVSTDFVNYLFCHFFFSPFRIFIIILLIIMSLNNVAAIAMDRFVGIRFPYFYRAHMTLQLSFVVVFFAWVFVIARAAILALFYRNTAKLAVIVEVSYGFTLLILTSFIYCQLYTTSMKHLNRDKLYGIKNQESKAMAAVIIAGVNAASWIPAIIVRFVDFVIVPVGYWLQLTFMSPFIGSCLNLLVYTYRLRDYRRAVKRLLHIHDAVTPQTWHT